MGARADHAKGQGAHPSRRDGRPVVNSRQYRRGLVSPSIPFGRPDLCVRLLPGAYTARPLTGMLRTVGLLHADADNLSHYAIKLYAKSRRIPDPAQPPDANAKRVEREFWKLRNDFRERFGNPDFPTRSTRTAGRCTSLAFGTLSNSWDGSTSRPRSRWHGGRSPTTSPTWQRHATP
jgi:hypothetical protein